MQSAAIQVRNRGVSCRHCGKPIRLSASLLKRETELKKDQPDADQQLQTKVFPARCRVCHAEGIYTVDQIVDL
jgi:cytochrome c5